MQSLGIGVTGESIDYPGKTEETSDATILPQSLKRKRESSLARGSDAAVNTDPTKDEAFSTMHLQLSSSCRYHKMVAFTFTIEKVKINMRGDLIHAYGMLRMGRLNPCGREWAESKKWIQSGAHQQPNGKSARQLRSELSTTNNYTQPRRYSSH